MKGSEKMLKVVKVIPVIKEKIEIDQYIPIKIRWVPIEESAGKLIYWRTGDLKKSMLEIGLSAVSGDLCSLTVVDIDILFFTSEKHVKGVSCEEGTPVFDVSNWIGKMTVDDIGLFEVRCYDKSLDMVISKNEIDREIISGRVSFGLDTDMNVCMISVNDLSDDEIFQIKDTMEHDCGLLVYEGIEPAGDKNSKTDMTRSDVGVESAGQKHHGFFGEVFARCKKILRFFGKKRSS